MGSWQILRMIDFRLYLITDRTLCSPLPLERIVKDACGEGVRAVQLREKDLPGRALYDQATTVRELTRQAGARLLINDRADIALAVGADGVHCTESGLPVDAARRLSPSTLVGASAHSLERAREAEAQGASFLLFGPVFDTPSKRRYGAPKGLDALSEVAEAVGIPVLAVGGITPGNAGVCIEKGAAGVGVISAIMSAGNLPEVVRAFKETLGGL